MVKNLSILGLLVFFPVSCLRPPVPGEPLLDHRVTRADQSALRGTLARADIVFLGRLTGADFSWHIQAGSIAISPAQLRFDVGRCLKGPCEQGKLDVFNIPIWNDVYLEASPEGGGSVRLSPQFFQAGLDYIVVAERHDLRIGDGLQYYVAGDDGYGVWFGDQENVSALEAYLTP